MKPEGNPTIEQARQLLASEEGKRLMQLLSQGGGKELRRAAEEFQKGNVSGAQDALRPVLSTPEARSFWKNQSKVGGRHGGL